MGDARLKILEEAYQVLESQGESPIAREYLLKLLDILAISLEKYAQESGEQAEDLAKHLIDHRRLLLTLKQQTDELDALKKLSINLTSSLELPDVLGAVVTEAMRLVGARGRPVCRWVCLARGASEFLAARAGLVGALPGQVPGCPTKDRVVRGDSA